MTARPDTRYPGPTLMSRARWLLEANHADRMLALSVASASLPVIGKQLEPLGGLAAMGVWGFRQFPELFASTAKSWFAPGNGAVRKAERAQTTDVAKDGLRGVVPAAELAGEWPAPEQVPPLWNTMDYRRNVHRTSVRYGDHPLQLLDVWRPAELPREPAPVLLFVPGGAWVHGSRILQGYAMLSHLAEQGWVCLSIDYRVAPHHRWPRHMTDVKAAIAWARANVDKFGGDRNFVALAGCSAGGHLAALAGLTPNDPELQGDLPEDADTSVDAVVGIYGRYDWEDRSTVERDRFVDFLERVVVGRKIDRHPEIFRQASPIARVHRDAPPFLVIHGSGDTVIPVAQARSFVERLESGSAGPVSYIEFPGAGHGFDMTDGARTGAMAKAIGLFLNQIHRNSSVGKAKAVI
ncbi:alpha/beta hydrolase [Mycolicibacterium diernhoferi]|uniref:Esterase n=1 Tax=Mycolicibacterium diernhoferi TaxID=1801 RepID=A0A1Q4HHK0_9MYCO|nr:alpha/beta hydrolase [Mycolicibacterium diernhoferi]OJZ66932.1 esterase [Mycolicibacterium diernhoferi]OPE55634.1 esterase [Mycolicibacterium diernhoferi]QYL23121.1 alpha/beta hydrolase [Mycolicibacterium diernhoferi]